MVAPSGEGRALYEDGYGTVSGPIDYLNTHGTSTPVAILQSNSDSQHFWR